MEPLKHHATVVAIEIDPAHRPGSGRAALLPKARAEQMLAHLSTDLSALVPGARACALTLGGALYDLSQLLRPGYPVFDALGQLLEASYGAQGFHPRLLSLGADGGRMPLVALDPDPSLPPGLLQLMPVLVSAPPSVLGPVIEATEHRFLEEGQVSAQTATALQAELGLGVAHARFMTLTDVKAMLRLQLEHFGFAPLWALIDAALEDEAGPVEARTDEGHRFTWRDGAVHARFETFDFWAREGAGRDLPADGQVLAGRYADWTRVERQYLATLSAHGIRLRRALAGANGEEIETSYVVESSSLAPAPGVAAVTEHSAGELGTVAVTTAAEGALRHWYPVRPEGLEDLHRAIREAGLAGGGVAFPGTIHYDPRQRALVADSLGA